MELPEPPALDDPRAVEQWRDTIASMSFEHGFQEGETATSSVLVSGSRRNRCPGAAGMRTVWGPAYCSCDPRLCALGE